ncbi:MAG: T9SS type A sorting domain-containing protein, partial [Bacteroidota bacterium]
ARLALPLRLDAPVAIDLALYDTLGRRVATLAEGTRATETITATLDVAAGVYVVRLAMDTEVYTQRIVVVP